MKKFNITVLFIFIITLGLKAQYLQDITGKPVFQLSYTDVQGSQFLYDNWSNGSVVTAKGKTYDKVVLKYDNYNDKIYFKSENGELLEFVDDIKSFTLQKDGLEKLYTKGFPEIDKFSLNTYFEVLFKGGNILLLFKPYKYLTETKAYNSATTEKKFVDNYAYYIFKIGKMEKFKPSKKEVLALFSDKSEQVNGFIKSSNIDFKSNTDLAKVFDFYYSSK